MNHSGRAPQETRRRFLGRLVTALGSILALIPIGAGLGVLLVPLRRKGLSGVPAKVTALDALPADGIPRRFPVIAARQDAWNTYPAATLGTVFLRRTNETTVEAFNAACPHAGCPVEYQADLKRFLCPCHKGAFTVEGGIADYRSPARRGLDSLEVEIRQGGEIWVRFRNFQPGQADKVPVT